MKQSRQLQQHEWAVWECKTCYKLNYLDYEVCRTCNTWPWEDQSERKIFGRNHKAWVGLLPYTEWSRGKGRGKEGNQESSSSKGNKGKAKGKGEDNPSSGWRERRQAQQLA